MLLSRFWSHASTPFFLLKPVCLVPQEETHFALTDPFNVFSQLLKGHISNFTHHFTYLTRKKYHSASEDSSVLSDKDLKEVLSSGLARISVDGCF